MNLKFTQVLFKRGDTTDDIDVLYALDTTGDIYIYDWWNETDGWGWKKHSNQVVQIHYLDKVP